MNERQKPKPEGGNSRHPNGEGKSLFPPGQLMATPGVLALSERDNINLVQYLNRHVCGDWGDLCAEDKHANNLALEIGGRILSAYNMPAGERLWVITEADRSATTILLPEEY